MRMTAIHTKTDESGRTGLSVALKNAVPGQERGGFTAGSARFQQPARPQTPLGAKKRLPRENNQAISASNGTPLGERRAKKHLDKVRKNEILVMRVSILLHMLTRVRVR